MKLTDYLQHRPTLTERQLRATLFSLARRVEALEEQQRNKVVQNG